MELENIMLFVLDKTSKVAKQFSEKEFIQLGVNLTVEQWVLLKVIDIKKQLSQNELAKETKRDPASITRTLDILQKKELIVREPIANNRRQYSIKLTVKGENFIVQNMAHINRIRNIAVNGFSQAEIETLISMLNRIQNNMA